MFRISVVRWSRRPGWYRNLISRATGRFGASRMNSGESSATRFDPSRFEIHSAEAATISGRFPAVHGAPVHVGAPEALGIRDLAAPDFGDPSRIEPGEIPVFWACGVTPQAAAMAVKPELMITHSPGHMLIGDIRDEALAVL